MQFNLKKDEINRLKVFNSYLKSCNNTAALKTEQLFVIDNNKLSVYGNGASGHITASFDIESNDSVIKLTTVPNAQWITFTL